MENVSSHQNRVVLRISHAKSQLTKLMKLSFMTEGIL